MAENYVNTVFALNHLSMYLCLTGFRGNAPLVEFSSILPEEVEEELRSAVEVSMGTEISQEDCENIVHLCDQVIEISEYRAQLYDYLKNRMMAIAPNLTLMVGELVGARLIAHAGKGIVNTPIYTKFMKILSRL